MPRLSDAYPFLLCAIVGASACTSKSDAPAGSGGNPHVPPKPPRWSADCDPIVPYHCGFPFPSNTQLVDDPAMPTGKHVELKPGTLPNHTNEPTDPAPWRDRDGFSVGGNIITDLPYATATGLPNENSLDLSIDPSKSPTILLDTSTGELVPHIAEIDVRNKKDVSYDYWDQTFMIRPVVRLKDATRYVVAVRRVVDAAGVPLDPSPEFKNLRDGTPSKEPSVEARRELYQGIFASLEAKGVHRGELQIAWDFSTASKENTTRWLVAMRDDALKSAGADGPPYVVDKVTENPNPHIARRIEGHLTIPNYLDNDGGPKLPHHLALGSDGLPHPNPAHPTYALPFIVQIPNSLATGDKPGPILQNGHGLLGSPSEGQNAYLAVDADQNGMVTIAVPLIGFAQEDNAVTSDTPVTTAVTSDVGTFEQIVDRQHMGIVGELLAMRMMIGKFAADPLVQYNGHSVIDPTTRYYRGDSQGGIFGATYMAVTTDVTRGILGEPGAPYSLLLYRSADFNPFFFILGLQYTDALDVNLALDLVQMFWDRVEPIGYVSYLAQENGLPNTPKHDILEQVAIGDHQVTPLGAHLIARAVGARQLKPVNRELFQIPDADSGFTGSGIVEFDFGLPPAPIEDEPMTQGEDPHDSVRVLPAVVQMENEFLRHGVVKNFCSPQPCTGT